MKSPSRKITKGQYRHYKGKLYEVIGEARHSESLEELVIYKALYQTEFGRNSLWVRPKEMFLQTVIIDGQSVPRFQKIKKKSK